MNFNYEVLSLILSIILFFLGMKYKEYTIKKNNIREKASSIDSTIIPMLKQKIKELSTHLDEKTYIKFDKLQPEPILLLNPNYFIDAVKPCSVFNIVDENIILVYTEDSNLKQHMNIALTYLNNYHTRACRLERLIASVYSLTPPALFTKTLKEIGINELGEDLTHILNPTDKDLFALYFIALTGSKNAYKNGSSFVIRLLNKRFNELQSAAVINPENVAIFNEIQDEINNIKYELTVASDVIQKLHEIWQNKLLI